MSQKQFQYLNRIIPKIISALQTGFRYADKIHLRICIENREWTSPKFKKSQFSYSIPVEVEYHVIGRIEAYYLPDSREKEIQFSGKEKHL